MIGDCEGARQVDRMSNNGGLKATETLLAYVEQHKEWGFIAMSHFDCVSVGFFFNAGNVLPDFLRLLFRLSFVPLIVLLKETSGKYQNICMTC